MSRGTGWAGLIIIATVLGFLAWRLTLSEAEAQSEGRTCNGLPVTIYAVSVTDPEPAPRSAPLPVFGTDGDDVILVVGDGIPPSDKAWIWGGSGNDTICVETDDVVVWGGPGDDWISGGGSEDWLKGQKGNDTIYGNRGHDVLWGGGGNDVLYGGWGEDELRGDTGADTLDGEEDTDYCNGGLGLRDTAENCEVALDPDTD